MKAVWHDQTVLSEEYFNQMMVFHSPTPGEPMVVGYGLGVVWFNPNMINGLTVYGHGGDPVGYAAAGLYLTDYGVSVAILDNTDKGETMGVISEILSIITKYVSPQS